MSTPAKLKKQALQLEHDRQYDKALAIYRQLLDEPDAGDDEVDVALYNRAGDLALRAGDAPRAVGYYERAVDLYAAGGLLNNAIALCNKILRHAPDRVATHYSLGVLHAKQGFRGDAKFHFVEYAERMHRAGRDDEALRALREFSELCAPGDDAGALLAQHLTRTGKGTQSAASLQAVFDTGVTAARPSAGAEPAPAPAPETPADGGRRGHASLVFLDLTGDAAPVDEEVAIPAVLGLEATGDVAGGFVDEPEVELDLLASPDDMAPWTPPAVTGFERTSWDGDTADRTLEGDGPSPARPGTHASALPGELPMLELPLAAAASRDAAPSVLVLEPVDADVEELGPIDLDAADVALVGAPELPFLPLASPSPADAPIALLDLDATVDEVVEAPLATPVALTAPAVVIDPVLAPVAVPPPAPTVADDTVDLGDWLREIEAPRSSRMVTAEPSQTGDEQADFERMLEAFKAGVERNIDGEDFESHYDLGVAFREMGLLEEAVTQFQRASRAPGRPLRAIEALGQCFVDLGQPELALESLRRATADAEPGAPALPDEQLVGVLYLLGVASEQTQRTDAAAAYYRRVLAIDIRFRDAARRLAQLSAQTR